MKEIPPFKLKLIPLNEKAKQLPKFLYAREDIGERNQLGGKPDFIQEKCWPICPVCKEKMVFYAQLDSINDDFCIGDCGMLYIFICLDCLETKTIIQSY